MKKVLSSLLLGALFCGVANAQSAPFTVGSNVALASLVTIADGHLQTVADTLEMAAATGAARSGNWTRIRMLLQEVTRSGGVPAGWLYARPDGSYWTLESGLQQTKIADRPYFRRAMAGHVSIGDLVTSRSTGRAVAVIAVPIRATNGRITGVLGAGVRLGALSRLIDREMDLGPTDLFWAIDRHGVIALHSDQTAIFVSPAKMSPQLAHVTSEMLAHQAGTQTYEFRGRTRTVVFRASALTGWRYGFGVMGSGVAP